MLKYIFELLLNIDGQSVEWHISTVVFQNIRFYFIFLKRNKQALWFKS